MEDISGTSQRGLDNAGEVRRSARRVEEIKETIGVGEDWSL